MHVERTWVVNKMDKSLSLRMTAHIDGREMQAGLVLGGHGRPMDAPADYAEHHLRRTIMASIEKELFK